MLKQLYVGEAKRKYVRGQRRIKGSSIQRTTLLESGGENNSPAKSSRALKDRTDAPCTHYYSEKKSKFNEYDDDWYTPCKTVGSEHPTQTPSFSPSQPVPRTGSPSILPRTPAILPRTQAPEQLVTVTSNPTNDPPLEIVSEQVDSASERPFFRTTATPSGSPSSLNPLPAPSEAPVSSNETIVEVEIDVDIPVAEKGSSCLQAKSGRVVPTSVNFTIHYKYELLVEREADFTGVVWPEVDRAFQRFLSLTLIDCEIDVEAHGASSTFRSRLRSISPEPIDSVGSLYPNGWSTNVSVASNATSCTNIVNDEELLAKRGLYCDVITGSITLYLSEVTYMDTASDPSILFLEYRDEVFQFLREEINERGEGISNYFDDSLGIRGFYFVSEAANLNLRPTSTVPGAASNNSNFSASFKEVFTSTPAIAGSLAALVAITVAAGAFAIQRKRNRMDELDYSLKNLRTPRMDDNEMEFYDLDMSDDGSTQESVLATSNTFSEENDQNHLQRSGDYTPRIGSSDIDAIIDINEKYNPESTSFDYSHSGVSMRLLSPDGTSSTYNPKRCDPSPTFRPDPDPAINCDESPKDESSEDLDSSSESTDSTMSKSLLDGTTPTPVKGSPALEYILGLGSSVMSSPNKPFDEKSFTKDQNDVESSTSIESPVQESIASTSTQGEETSSLPYISDRRNKNAASPKGTSENGVTSWGIFKTMRSLATFERDDGSSIESPPSSSSEYSHDSRSEYLKNRRKQLENRFQSYRRNLSERINDFDDSPSGSWSASREFTRSVSLYKNSDQSFSPTSHPSNDTISNESIMHNRISDL